jgi:hypothetical protein
LAGSVHAAINGFERLIQLVKIGFLPMNRFSKQQSGTFLAGGA